MYSTTADKMHRHGRIGSHATKGSGRGAVWWNTPAEEPEIAVKPPLDQRILATVDRLSAKVHMVRKQLKAAHAAGDQAGVDAAKMFLQRVSRLRRGVIREGAMNYSDLVPLASGAAE